MKKRGNWGSVSPAEVLYVLAVIVLICFMLGMGTAELARVICDSIK